VPLSQSISHYYDDRAARYSQSYQRCGWRSPDTQHQRFWALTHHFELNDAIVLDSGCGDGEFFSFRKSEFPQWRYVGIDLSPGMITQARERFPDGLFMEADLHKFTGDYDYVICSGALNHKNTTPMETLLSALTSLYTMSQVATAITLLSNQCPSEDQSEPFLYYDPRSVLALAQTLTPYVDLNHTYARNDFCLTLFRR
jgi:SAM-dependent methyltransferase